MSLSKAEETSTPAPATGATMYAQRDRLLAPIPGPNPAGEWLLYEGTYDAIREARRADDESLPRGIWETELRKSDWESVARLCEEALTERTKDLQIALWLVEANLNLHGMATLAPGIRFLDQLCDKYWESMYPEMSADDPEYRSAPIAWMGQRFAQILRVMPVTQRVDRLGRPLSLADWESCIRSIASAEEAGEENRADTGDGGLTPKTFLLAAAATPSGQMRDMAARADDALRELDGFEAACDRRFEAADAPSVKPLRDALVAVKGLVMRILRERGEETVVANVEASESETIAQGSAQAEPGCETRDPPSATRSGPIQSREEAYRQLKAAAEFLLRTEPHSPTPYLVLRAVSWGHRTLDEVLHEIVSDGPTLVNIRHLLGIDTGSAPGEASHTDTYGEDNRDGFDR